MAGPSRFIETLRDADARLTARSVLCLPLGSTEQHGPHLPLETDTLIAEALTERIVTRWSPAFDLWRLSVLTVGLSREHGWAPGTKSHSVAAMTALLLDQAREIAATPARNLLIVNGHGGNRGILEAVGYEFAGDFGLNVCALHLGAVISPVPAHGLPEIHAGKDETSVMLAIAPDKVRRERIAELRSPPDPAQVRAAILDPAVSWPWSSGDPRIADLGVIGDPREASAEYGREIVERVVQTAGDVLRRLIENAELPRTRPA
jgi:creatinine amidohydrolase/Fe(II)-dependent formamide hydrolase-like protein